MAVRAKLKVTELTAFESPKGAVQVKMSAVYETKSGESGQACEENRIFGQYTPSATFIATIVNPDAGKQFEVGKAYYLDFTPAPE